MLRIERLHIALQELIVHFLRESLSGEMRILQHQ